MTRALAPLLLVVTGAAVLAVTAGCLGETPACVAADECAGDEVCRAGRCVDPAALDAGAPAPDDGGRTLADGGTAEPAPDVDGGALLLDGGAPAPEPEPAPGPGCVPNHDGTLTAAELPVALGVSARYVATGSESEPVAVDLVGTVTDAGVRTWSLADPLPGDTAVELGPVALDEVWFGADFPDGEYAAPLDAARTAWGVFGRDGDDLLLHGVASDVEDETLLVYDPPVVTARFPLEDGVGFSSETDVSGTFESNPFYISTDTWDVTVDGRGNLVTPAGTYDVLRVRTVLEVSVPIAVFPFELVYRYTRYAFLTECLGQVAYVASLEDEAALEFTSASEVRRLGLP